MPERIFFTKISNSIRILGYGPVSDHMVQKETIGMYKERSIGLVRALFTKLAMGPSVLAKV